MFITYCKEDALIRSNDNHSECRHMVDCNEYKLFILLCGCWGSVTCSYRSQFYIPWTWLSLPFYLSLIGYLPGWFAELSECSLRWMDPGLWWPGGQRDASMHVLDWSRKCCQLCQSHCGKEGPWGQTFLKWSYQSYANSWSYTNQQWCRVHLHIRNHRY